MNALLLPVLALGFLAAADPAPPGDHGYLTRAELDKLTFGPPARKLRESRDQLIVKDMKAAVAFPKPAVEAGEPATAYVVFRWAADPPRDLPGRVEVASPDLKEGLDALLHVVDAKTGKPVPERGRRVERFGGLRKEIELPKNGYYVLAADLTDDLDLDPGEYEVYATYAGLCSSAAKLTVTKESAQRGRDSRRLAGKPQRRLSEVYEIWQRVGKPSFHWAESVVEEMGDRPEAQLAFRLGLGGRFYPDIRRAPAADDRLRVTAAFAEKGGRDRLTVTFTPADPKGPPVLLPVRPRLAVMVEPAGDERFEDPKQSLQPLPVRPDDTDPPADHAAPKALTVELPKDWRAAAGYPGKCRVSVVVTSADFDRAERARKPLAGEWVGVLKTDPVVLTFPEQKDEP
jgi:hypothetical protein